ncbi:LexA family protein [Gallibacter sp. Marseille-QA0791]|uniref:LexA family protein n=1 Tax=Gallibacter sp. Marseille-QA0791 TaxID=3378781 RepID=UPI003D118B12
MATTAERIQQAMEKNNITQAELCRKTKIGKSSLSTYLSGDYEPKQRNLYKLATALNVTPEWLMGLDVPMNDNDSQHRKSTGVSIPIVSTIVAGMPADAYEDPLGYEEISHELAKTGDFICLKVKGDSMSPAIQDGDLVIIRQQNDVESGDIAVVRINGDEATLKKVQKSADGITLIAYNPAVYEPHFYSNKEIEELPVEIDGKVVEMKRVF